MFSSRDHIHQSAEPCSQMSGLYEKQPVNGGVFQYSPFRSQQSFGMKRQRMLFLSSSLYRKENQLPLFIGDIISSLLSSRESLFLKFILPPTQTQDRQKSNQNLAEADAMLRKPSSNLRYEETVPVL